MNELHIDLGDFPMMHTEEEFEATTEYLNSFTAEQIDVINS
jgi:hypothetical protein